MSHREAMHDPLPAVMLAIEGRVDFVIKTTVGGKAEKPKKPISVADQVKAWAAEMGAVEVKK